MKKNCSPKEGKMDTKKHEKAESKSKEKSEDKKFIERAKGKR